MNAAAQSVDQPSLVKKFASKYSIDPKVLLTTLKNTCFRQSDGEVTNEQMVALLVVADVYNLNPFTKEIYAFPDKNRGIVPVVSVDGWVRIINEHKDYNGYDVILPNEPLAAIPGERPAAWEWVTIRLHRKNVEYTPALTEYLDECYRPPIKKNGNNGPYTINGPWQSHPKRFLRHKALIQAARVVFGFAGIYDDDEAQRILEAGSVVSVVPRAEGTKATDVAKANLKRHLEQTRAETLETKVEQAEQALVEEKSADPAVNQAQPKHDYRYDIPAALTHLRSQNTVAQLKGAFQEIVDDYEFSGRELPLDVEAVYRDLKEMLEGGGK
jgi:phage recombination protein Bet